MQTAEKDICPFNILSWDHMDVFLTGLCGRAAFLFFASLSVAALTGGGLDGGGGGGGSRWQREEGREVTDALIVNSKSLVPPSLWRGRQEERGRKEEEDTGFLFI